MNIREAPGNHPPGHLMVDSFGRRISYVRISVTDRCDLRCRYCMAEKMTFLPRGDILTFEEILLLAEILIGRGVRKIRLTGGEPLVRRGVEHLIAELGKRVGNGLDELTMTTNGTQLAAFAEKLHRSGMRRLNVSLDTRDPDRFRHITRRGDVGKVLGGLGAASAAGLKVKVNMVALRGLNEDEIAPMLRWCGERGYDLTLIETMPLGEIEDDRAEHYLPLSEVKERLEREFELIPSPATTGGPARYFEVGGSSARLGFITPLTNNFCNACNRIRISATGTIYGCLGQNQKVELRDALRSRDLAAVQMLLEKLVQGKPRGHEFRITARSGPAVERHMSVTGG